MKSIKNNTALALFFGLIITLGVASCKKSFLELADQNNLSTPIYFKTPSDLEKAIAGSYAPLRGLYGRSAFLMGEFRSDNTAFTYNSDNRSFFPIEYVDQFLDDATSDVTSGKYVGDYAVIARVNQVLTSVEGVEFSDQAVKNRIKGEAYFLRALSYFDLVQYYGDVPLHLKPATTLAETSLPLSKADVVYGQVIEDAKQAASLLPAVGAKPNGRATSGAANMLLGNIYIVQRKWADAEAALKKVTGYSLLNDYADVFSTANKNSAESIFEIQYMQGIDGYASSFLYQFLPQPITSAEVAAVTGIAGSSSLNGEGLNIPTPDMLAAYEPNDLRQAISIGTTPANGKAYPYVKKYQHPHTLPGNTDDNFPVYRYAELLLFMAEAVNEQGRTAEALPFLNQIRKRAGLADFLTADQATLRVAIQRERRVELAFENKRWLDLVRTGEAEKVMKEQGLKIKANPQSYYYPAGTIPPANAFTNIRILFPIPASESTLNPYF